MARRRKAAGSRRAGERTVNRDTSLMRAAAKPKRVDQAAAKALKSAARAAMPSFVTPCLATLVDTAPEGTRWLHEIKFDGYRIQARLDRGKVKLMTRKGLDWTDKFPTVARSIGKLKAKAVLIDGEIVSEDKDGISRFSLLQQDLKAGRHDRMVFYAFDLMHLNGVDLTSRPVEERKAALAKLIGRRKTGVLRLSESLTEGGAALLAKACKMGLEGLISKRADAPYRSGRGHDWLKSKCSDRQEFVVTGFAPSTADSHAVGALVLGVNEGGKLRYAGRVGTGFTHEVARDLYRTLRAIERKTAPLAVVPKEERGSRRPVWVEPKMVVEVDFHGWTHGDRVRQASFQGVREDKAAKDVVHEVKT